MDLFLSDSLAITIFQLNFIFEKICIQKCLKFFFPTTTINPLI